MFSIYFNNFYKKKLTFCFIFSVRGEVVDSPATYTSEHEYITYEAYGNWSYFSRALPPVPRDCPTPHGIWGEFRCIFDYGKNFIVLPSNFSLKKRYIALRKSAFRKEKEKKRHRHFHSQHLFSWF